MARKRGSARRAAKSRGKFEGEAGAEVVGTDDDMLAALLAKEVGGELWAAEKKGDAISGIVKSIESRNTRYGWQMCVLIDTGAAGVYLVFMNSHIEREFQTECIVPGDVVGIMFKGEVSTQAGEMKLYAIVNKTQSADSIPERIAKRYEHVARERARRAGRELDEEQGPF